ncbi:carboxypeptidase-like regulatory domain-containing protein [Taibaiella soli]|uniref:carboxypeptidase-like regulatory domain-containing protein n=1 Tax=Taibaiella soli TaxID=1649169 RepID=UPI001FB3FA0E|nr:carboxypeptidase-like regulatory domain-containing protein [Taibaiella soli]
MRTRLSYITCLIITILFAARDVNAQSALYDNIIQITGVVMTADSLRGVPDVNVIVKNKNRGATTSNQGVFTLVLYKGDTLQFSAIGFRGKEYVIPTDAPGHYFSLIQLMVQDTFYLPETIIRPMLSRDQFDYAFKNWHIPDDQYEMARKNTNEYTLRALAYTLPRDGRESQAQYQSIQATNAIYYGQNPAQRPMNIFSPLAWAEFFDAWKRGDFRKKQY